MRLCECVCECVCVKRKREREKARRVFHSIAALYYDSDWLGNITPLDGVTSPAPPTELTATAHDWLLSFILVFLFLFFFVF